MPVGAARTLFALVRQPAAAHNGCGHIDAGSMQQQEASFEPGSMQQQEISYTQQEDKNYTWLGLACLGLAWPGLVWLDRFSLLVWLGLV